MHPFVGLLIRLALGTAWLMAGAGKLARKEARGEAVGRFGLLPGGAANAVGAGLPFAELTLGALLLAGLGIVAAAAASAGLLALFSLAIIVNLLRGRRIECHCFGQMGHAPISWWSVARNAGLLTMALGLALFHSEYLTIDGWLRGAAIRPSDPPPLDFVPVLLLALTAAVLAALAVSAWEVAKAVGGAEGGPALGLPERRYLLRWTAPGAGTRAASAEISGDNGR